MIIQTEATTKRRSYSLTVEVPDKLNGQDDLIRQAIATALYNKGDLTMQEAREFLGNVSRRDFEENILPAFGYSIVEGLTEDDIKAELDVLKKYT